MLTKQKAEPLLGMKLTLLRSGHKKGGISCRGLGLEAQCKKMIECNARKRMLVLLQPAQDFECAWTVGFMQIKT